MVLDRLFLWVFGVVAFLGSFIILSASPYMFDEISPIDAEKSIIGKTEETLNSALIG